MYPELSLGAVSLPTYFLVVALASALGGFWFVRRAERRDLNKTVALDLVLLVLAAGFIGARLFHVFYEEPAYYAEHPWRVLHVWNGGFVFLGGLFASFFTGLWFCQWQREPFWLWADLAALPTSLAYAIGRLGCFLNGCCFGRECHYPWAFVQDGVPRHPAPLYASAYEFIWLFILTRLEPRWRVPGTTFHVWLIGHALGRLVMESFRDDPRGPLLGGLSIGTWLSLGLASLAATHLSLALNAVKKGAS